ncbi:MAG: Na(+)/H(+) antiporter subunit D [Gammaproteobacteria bacterium]|nr:Na(+)/H(+) antiporter subunit D [Gammaproteobacteria bacterium]
MITNLNPALILVLGPLLIPVLKGNVRTVYTLLLPVLSFVQLYTLPAGSHAEVEVFDLTLMTLHMDRLSFMFAVIFHIAAFIATVYSLHLRDSLQQAIGLVYAGCALGVVLAGDLVTLFIYWEAAAVSSVFLIWARRTPSSYRAGMRYLIIQVISGFLLLAGIILHARAGGSIEFTRLDLNSPGGLLIFLAFGIKCAFPLLHSWLVDAYPEATETGTVVLSAFTTKMAVYALATAFPGTEILIWIGLIMTAFPIFYAVIENDLRRVLTYSMINQLGFMVVGVGIGTELALNGTAAHAFADILFKGLLFMSMGAVLLRTGKINGSDLGGLYKSMPYTTGFCIIGAASISAFPLFSAFVTKSMIMEAAAHEGLTLAWLVMLFASAGVFHHAGIKIPFFAFFAHDSGIRCKEAPVSMLIAMALAAAVSMCIGIFPQTLYALLPYQTEYEPFTFTHVITQLQLLLFSALAFTWLLRQGIYPPELHSVNIDADWLYRKPGAWLARQTLKSVASGEKGIFISIKKLSFEAAARLHRHHGPQGLLAKTWPTGSMVLWVAFLLGVYLIFYYLY